MQTRRLTSMSGMLAICLLVVGADGQTMLYVDETATGADDGSSWCDAYVYLQDALTAASISGIVTEIHVARGTYTPDHGVGQTPGDRTATFRLLNGVALRGGYAGCGAPDPDERDEIVYATILSGDLAGDDEIGTPGPGGDCCEQHDAPGCANPACEALVCAEYDLCCDPERTWSSVCASKAAALCCDLCSSNVNTCENAHHVATALGVDPSCVIDGVTIRAGRAGKPAENYTGAGLLLRNSSPNIRSCRFSDNVARWGAGVDTAMGDPEFIDCTFEHNEALNRGGGMSSYGAYDAHVKLRLVNCRFIGNIARDGSGGGLHNHFSDATLENCTFSDNRGGAFENGGSISTLTDCRFIGNITTGAGGAVGTNTYPTTVFMNCLFLGNQADHDGGAVNVFSGPASFRNCVFSGNIAQYGGAVGVSHESEATFRNCTLSHNVATIAGGGVRAITPVEFDNSVLWGNTAPTGPALAISNSTSATVRYSAVEGGQASIRVYGGSTLFWETGNIVDGPMLADALGPDGVPGTTDDNPRLNPDSPAIDTGDPLYAAEPGETDLDGHARVLCERVDMGAYESGMGNFDCDLTLDLGDFAGWGSCMTGPGSEPVVQLPGCEAFDFEFDGDVDIHDFAEFQRIFTGLPIFDVCNPDAGGCLSPNGTPGCEDTRCCDMVCLSNPPCCVLGWDATCADEASRVCPLPCGYPEDGSCFLSNGSPGCNDLQCCEVVCAMDLYCCATEWDETCVDLAMTGCR